MATVALFLLLKTAREQGLPCTWYLVNRKTTHPFRKNFERRFFSEAREAPTTKNGCFGHMLPITNSTVEVCAVSFFWVRFRRPEPRGLKTF